MSRPMLIVLGVLGVVALTVSWALPRVFAPVERFSVAMDLIADHRAAEAVHLLDAHDWRGIAEYRAGRYRRAATEFIQGEDATALYNLGTANARLGEWTAARAAYERVLALAPGHEDAAFNLALVKQAEARQREEEANERQERKLGAEKSPPGVAESEGDTSSDKTTTENAVPSDNATPTDKMSAQSGQISAEGRLGETPLSEDSAAGRGALAEAEEREGAGQTGTSGLRVREQSAQDAEILLRAIRDDPARVLAARLRAIHRNRKEAGQ